MWNSQENSYAPMYVYSDPMFMVTVSVVVIYDNQVLILKDEEVAKFPSGPVRAGKETIQFAAIRLVKEQVGITLSKSALIPVDFRSDPSRSCSGNVVDLGFVTVVNSIPEDFVGRCCNVDFEKRDLEDVEVVSEWFEDHNVLLDRAINVALMVKED